MAHSSDPTETLSRAREALRVVLVQPDRGPEAVAALLPMWFVEACGPELTIEEADARLAAWRADPAAHESDPWSVLNWTYTFEPEQRSWWWWDADVAGDDRLRITIVVEGFPFGSGNLVWLLTAAGASEVTVP